jgi:hypothetical protein
MDEAPNIAADHAPRKRLLTRRAAASGRPATRIQMLDTLDFAPKNASNLQRELAKRRAV